MTKYLSIMIVLAFVVVGFAYYALFAGPNREVTEQLAVWSGEGVSKEAEDETYAEEPRSGKSSLEAIRDWNRDVECTVEFIADDVIRTEQQKMSIQGTYFVSQGDIRGDFLTPAPDLQGTILSSMIITEKMFYFWSEIEGEKFGVSGSTIENKTLAMSQGISMDSVVTYNCKPWNEVDKAIFVPPSDVLFKDQNSLLESGMEYGTIYIDEE